MADDLTSLARDLGDAPRNAGPFLRKALQVTAGKVKKDAATSAGKSAHFGQAAQAIDYDINATAADSGSSLTIDVGYNKGKTAGELGNLLEFGAPDATYGGKQVPLAPRSDLANALEANSDDFEHGIERAVNDALKELGL